VRYVAEVFWLTRPPLLRWLAAAAIVVIAAYTDLRGTATERYPFVAAIVPTGASVADAIQWREVPVGLLPEAGDAAGHAVRRLDAGEPLTAAATANDGPVVPSGWWSIAVPLPPSAAAGGRVRLVSAEEGLDVEGVIVEAAALGAFATTTEGLVAVPPATAAPVAQAVSRGALVVLVGT
jgi:hypothetical protein